MAEILKKADFKFAAHGCSLTGHVVLPCSARHLIVEMANAGDI